MLPSEKYRFQIVKMITYLRPTSVMKYSPRDGVEKGRRERVTRDFFGFTKEENQDL